MKIISILKTDIPVRKLITTIYKLRQKHFRTSLAAKKKKKTFPFFLFPPVNDSLKLENILISEVTNYKVPFFGIMGN